MNQIAERVGEATFEKRGDGGGACSVQVTVSERYMFLKPRFYLLMSDTLKPCM